MLEDARWYPAEMHAAHLHGGRDECPGGGSFRRFHAVVDLSWSAFVFERFRDTTHPHEQGNAVVYGVRHVYR